MSNFTNEDVVQALGHLTVLEMIALTKQLEQRWGVKAEPRVGNISTVVQSVEEVSSQTEFDVVLVSYPADKKIAMVKLVRELLSLGLLESKALVESVPKTLKEGVSKDDAEAIKAKLSEAGGIVELK